MEKDIVSARIRPELRRAFQKEAKKNDRTLSYYIEQLLEEVANRKKLIPKKEYGKD